MNPKFLRKMQTMEQFSHDLTIALEETSRSGVRDGKWGQRRRTRSTGNLPCALQPTEASSSSPTDTPIDMNPNQNQDGLNMLSDSDDRHDLRLSLKSRHVGNFESDSLNENFSPARFFRSNTRRKRKFKRMAVEYETTPSTPGAGGENISNPVFPVTGTVKKRVLKHTTQDNYRANLFFFGKRKRSHRDRYYDHDHSKQHSSSVPRQRDFFASKTSYQEHKARTRSFSSTTKYTSDRILPLNKNIISKIEKISQQKKPELQGFAFASLSIAPKAPIVAAQQQQSTENIQNIPQTIGGNQTMLNQVFSQCAATCSPQGRPRNYPCFSINLLGCKSTVLPDSSKYSGQNILLNETKSTFSRRKHKHNRFRREHLRAQLQFDNTNSMECGLTDFLSSSSLSSSDSEAGETNESDREGDDELTDWPGNEAMINFASKNDFKRKLTKKSNLPQIKSDDYAAGGDDDTLMSADEIMLPAITVHCSVPHSSKPIQSQPIAIASSVGLVSSQQFRFPAKQIESEMSGETSNHFLSSPPRQAGEIREIRAGCRRIREERPGFTIMTSVNERLSRFLQDAKQTEIRLPDIEVQEHESLSNLAKLYSLQMSVENDCAILKKTSNTTQSVKIDQSNLGNRFLLSDFKRLCYDGQSGSVSQETVDCPYSNHHPITFKDHERGDNVDETIEPFSMVGQPT